MRLRQMIEMFRFRDNKQLLIFIVFAFTLSLLSSCSLQPQEPWLTEELIEEFTSAKSDTILTFDDYLKLEDRLFQELKEKVYARVGSGPAYNLVRYSSGSAADPQNKQTNWNRSFEFSNSAPIGGVLLLHGMSDSPYSLRALANYLKQKGYWVIGLRLPGHGTAPSGLKHITMDDMNAAVRLGMKHLSSKLKNKSLHMVGYSNGAALALEFTLDAMESKELVTPASLVLISPAIRIHPIAALARFKEKLSHIPGLGSLAWTQILPEFDPYKYNSFTTNAGHVVHQLTRSVDRRIAERTKSQPFAKLPPILVFKSTVDATVNSDAVVDRLMARLPSGRNELVLFDINRFAAKSSLLISDPAPFTTRLMSQSNLPFAITLVTNENPDTKAVIAQRKIPFSTGPSSSEFLRLLWPSGVLSLSHVALPFPPDDPLYGRQFPSNAEDYFLGDISLKGEYGILKLPSDWLLRMRYNPFYKYIENRVIDWFENAN